MAESNEPENPHKTEPDPSIHHDPAEHEPTEPDTEGEGEEGAPIDPDIRTGFSFEQRRFLWTLAGMNVVAVLLGAAIIVGYQATARSQDAAAVKLEDVYVRANETFTKDDQSDRQAMFAAKLSGDEESYNERRDELKEAFRLLQEAHASARRAKGLDAQDVTPQDLDKYETYLDRRTADDIARFRASTQPATEPATQSATQPDGHSAAKPGVQTETKPAGKGK